MFLAMVNGERRPPRAKGERAVCRCGAELIAVLPLDYSAHWRHKGGDCDPWSEPEGPWHLGWKAKFPVECCEVGLQDETTGEWHRADVRAMQYGGGGFVLELQHSSISPEEQLSREAFYSSNHRMCWLLHIHDDSSFRGSYFNLSLSFNDPVDLQGRVFYRMSWYGNKRFIERWKQCGVSVVLDLRGHLFYLATRAAHSDLVASQKKGEFALMRMTPEMLIAWVLGNPPPPPVI
jgi:hypothetical protein